MNNKEFDRSVCFQFYESYLEQAELVKEQLGPELCAEYFIALAKYGLYQEESDNPIIKMLVSGLKNTIDAGQTKRARGFNGENKEKTEAILKYKQEHSDASQREIANACGCSIGKVNKVINSNLNSNNNINNNSNSNINSVNVNVNTEEKKKENPKRKIDDLEDHECEDIYKRIKNHESYISISNRYNLEPGSITKDFLKWYEEKKRHRAYLAEQQAEAERRKNEPIIDYNRLSARANNPEKEKEEKEHQEIIDEVARDLWSDSYDTTPRSDDSREPDSLKIMRELNELQEDDIWSI